MTFLNVVPNNLTLKLDKIFKILKNSPMERFAKIVSSFGPLPFFRKTLHRIKFKSLLSKTVSLLNLKVAL